MIITKIINKRKTDLITRLIKCIDGRKVVKGFRGCEASLFPCLGLFKSLAILPLRSRVLALVGRSIPHSDPDLGGP